MSRVLGSAIVWTLCVSLSQAAFLRVLDEGKPTVGLPGFTTFTLSLELGPGDVFRGFSAHFQGALNQVKPFGQASIFTDANAAIDAVCDVSQDS